MSQHAASTTSGQPSVSGTNTEQFVSLIPGIDGDLQVVRSRTGHILIDVQSVHFDAEGNQRDDHSTLRLTDDALSELRALLDRIAEPPEPRQPSLWSASTFTHPIPARPRKRRVTA
jgi:hypothetical protein